MQLYLSLFSNICTVTSVWKDLIDKTSSLHERITCLLEELRTSLMYIKPFSCCVFYDDETLLQIVLLSDALVQVIATGQGIESKLVHEGSQIRHASVPELVSHSISIEWLHQVLVDIQANLFRPDAPVPSIATCLDRTCCLFQLHPDRISKGII